MIIEECKYGNLVYCLAYYNDNHQLHREDGPAKIERNKITGGLIMEVYSINGLSHRDNDLPAVIHYCNGIVVGKYWIKDGCYYRKDKPSYQAFYNTGSIYREYFYDEHNRNHNLNGPALICYDKVGNITSKNFYVEDILYNEEQYNELILAHSQNYFKISGRI